MRLVFKHSGRDCFLQKASSLRAHMRMGGQSATGKSLPPRALMTDSGLNVVVGAPCAHDPVPSDRVRFSAARQTVEGVEDIGWIGKDVLLLRLRMRDLDQQQDFERWMVFDCAHEDVEYLTHDLFAPPGCVLRTIRSSARGHVWLQCLRVQPEDCGLQQVVGSDGGVLELHRLPLSALLSTDDEARPLLGRQSRFYSPTLLTLTAGEYKWLEPGEQVLVDDVREAGSGDLSFVVALSARCATELEAEAEAELLHLYELVRRADGQWRGEHLFAGCDDEQWMIF